MIVSSGDGGRTTTAPPTFKGATERLDTRLTILRWLLEKTDNRFNKVFRNLF